MYPEHCELHHAPRSAIAEQVAYYKCDCQYSMRTGIVSGWQHVEFDDANLPILKTWPVPKAEEAAPVEQDSMRTSKNMTPSKDWKKKPRIVSLTAPEYPPEFDVWVSVEDDTATMHVVCGGRSWRFAGVLESPAASDWKKP